MVALVGGNEAASLATAPVVADGGSETAERAAGQREKH